MKVKLLQSNWNPETGRSEVVISTKYGKFSAHAQVADEDKEYASRFLGCEIAEKKAVIKALKSHKRELYIAWKEAWHMFDTFEQSNWKIPKCIYSRMKELENKIANVEDHIDIIEYAIELSVAKYIKGKKG